MNKNGRKFICTIMCLFCMLLVACVNQRKDAEPAANSSFIVETPVQSPTATPYDTKYSSLSSNRDKIVPLIYLQTYEDREIDEIEISGVLREGKLLHWNKFMDEVADQENLEGQKTVKTQIVKPGQRFKLYDIISRKSYNAHIDGLPSMFSNESGEHLTVGLCLDEKSKMLPRGYYIGIWGDWRVFPDSVKKLDTLGSISADLNYDGKQELIQAEKVLHDEYYSNVLYTITNNNKRVKIDYFYLIANEGTWEYQVGEIPPAYATYSFVVPIDVNGDGQMEIIVLNSCITTDVTISMLDDLTGTAYNVYYEVP